MNKNVSSEYGQIRIYKKPILQIAELAAKEIKGVKKVGWECYGIVGSLAKGLNVVGTKVLIENNKTIKIVVPIITSYGVNSVDVSYEVQKNIASKVMTMLTIDSMSIDIKIRRVERGAK